MQLLMDSDGRASAVISKENSNEMSFINHCDDSDSETVFFGTPKAKELQLRQQHNDWTGPATVRKLPTWSQSPAAVPQVNLFTDFSANLSVQTSIYSSALKVDSLTSTRTILHSASINDCTNTSIYNSSSPSLFSKSTRISKSGLPLTGLESTTSTLLAHNPLFQHLCISYLDEDVYFCIPDSQPFSTNSSTDLPWEPTSKSDTPNKTPQWKTARQFKRNSDIYSTVETSNEQLPILPLISDLPTTPTKLCCWNASTPSKSSQTPSTVLFIATQLQHSAALRIQRWIRHIFVKKCVFHSIRQLSAQYRLQQWVYMSSVITIQYAWRRWIRYKQLLRMKSATIIQTAWREMQSRHHQKLNVLKNKAATKIQLAWKCFTARNIAKALFCQKVIHKQNLARYNSVCTISRWWYRIMRDRKHRQYHATVIKLQSLVRRFQARKRFIQIKTSAKQILQAWRSYKRLKRNVHIPNSPDVLAQSLNHDTSHLTTFNALPPVIPILFESLTALPISTFKKSSLNVPTTLQSVATTPSQSLMVKSTSRETDKKYQAIIEEKKKQLEEIRQKKLKLKRQLSGELTMSMPSNISNATTASLIPNAIPSLSFEPSSSNRLVHQQLHTSIHQLNNGLIQPVDNTLPTHLHGFTTALKTVQQSIHSMKALDFDRLTRENTRRNALCRNRYVVKVVNNYGTAPPSPTTQLMDRIKQRKQSGVARTFTPDDGVVEIEPPKVRRIQWDPALIDICESIEPDSNIDLYTDVVQATAVKAQPVTYGSIKPPNVGMKRKLADYHCETTSTCVSLPIRIDSNGFNPSLTGQQLSDEAIRSKRRKSCLRPVLSMSDTTDMISSKNTESVVIQRIRYVPRPVISNPARGSKIPPKVKKAQHGSQAKANSTFRNSSGTASGLPTSSTAKVGMNSTIKKSTTHVHK
ncbi:hypothetical protein BATDEDRAFT_35161 [Batrachochytrium dendrobatidis JAM81]|uniref:Uncharacterized protein n=1 Tax=Batrachochytrium dendrobatidis (strain JAM81 / FGSC 10211) TaxID=684364 RepID=F4P3V5_BATDJ|nr:uncharacterized protein BATDEDRAFT_35161 [Batrachochytrium dendrobatidis JAM81]EGF80286.1 hypothetical protein BATDEDRAFT_35161 [Batrachochytrium dendrobatidis JAM81]|eukprot:XP_006679126.1 hypothetical protein BATDEDRAFT_35161 [Batrachochytrium dendrobatidis JAM81]